MNLLLDTHILLWWLNDDQKLDQTYREIISASENLCYVSAVSIWEISIKKQLGKLKISDEYLDEIHNEGFLELSISWHHSNKVSSLPLIHKDPFDRLLIAQAQLEHLCLMTVEEKIKQYKVKTL